MADVASLGLAVDSSGVKQGAASLNLLSTAATKAEAAAAGLSSTTRNASAAAASLAASSGNAAAELSQEGAAAAKSTAALQSHYIAANNNSVAAKNTGTQMRMMAMQLSQVAQQTQASGNFIQALAIQLPDLALGFGTVGIALGVLAGILLPLIHAGRLTADVLNFIADSLVDIAPYAVAAAAALALLYAPAILGGLTLLSEAILGVAARLAGMAAGFLLANPAVAFVAGMTLAIAAANIFRDELTQIFGVDIVGVAKDAVNFVIGAFVGGFHAIQDTWAQMPAALGDIVYSTAQTVVSGIEAMVQSAVDALNNLTNKAALALAKVGHPLSPEAYGSLILGPVDFGSVKNPYAGASQNAVGSVKESFGSAMDADYVGAGLKVIEKGASAATGKVKELASWLAKIDDPKATKAKGHHGKSDEEKFDDIVTDAKTKLATLKAEQASVGMSELATAKLRYETELLNEAQRKGITLTAGQRAELMGLADQMAETAVQTKNAKEQLAFAKDATKGFIDDLQQGLENGKGFWQSFGDAALNVLDKIISKIEDELIESLFSLDGGGSGGGIGGILDFALNGFKGFATGGYTGGAAANKVAGIVHGGEYVFSKRATDNIGVGALDRLHGFARSGNSGSGGGAPAANANQAPAYNDNRVFNIDARGAQQGVGAEIQQALAAYDRQMPARVKQINADPRKR
ncbi:phage tail tape-measure protein [Mesorhizobium sp. B2-3-4]|uniref:phage tail tape-measure protein n=1 Tax=Mesorhizobium sp. B2-3-4 TaxID=2589959 RepID=UPI00112CBA0E|nr:phage tail tape-measure protein [Mesorhizobium sp. B2-3-4]TPM39581.1 phage tail tape-measure protein [Mesorhizobium sp. B2-3-4]